ncbi:MAG: sensor histidine kinase [Bacteroidetes bacterium]|nr:sensor histidine kinase [Bacteroidota bacterium]
MLENAMVFKADVNSKVRVGSSLNGENISIVIKDNGIGIHEKVKDQIFKMFVKGSE